MIRCVVDIPNPVWTSKKYFLSFISVICYVLEIDAEFVVQGALKRVRPYFDGEDRTSASAL